jgi:hypothetical protein
VNNFGRIGGSGLGVLLAEELKGKDGLPSAQALRADPEFPQAMRHAGAGLIALRQRDFRASWFLNDRALAVLHHVILCFDAEANDADPGSGLTPGRFKAFCAERGFCSPGRAGAILAWLRVSGMLRAERTPDDRRIVRLRPSERLREAARARLRVHLAAFAPLHPTLAPAAARLGCPAFENAVYRALAALLAQGRWPPEPIPALARVARRDSGALILLALFVDSEPAGPASRDLIADLSIASLARQLRLSRAHVLRVVRDAEADALLQRLGPDGKQVRLTGLLVDSLATLHAAIAQVLITGAVAGQSGAPTCTCCTAEPVAALALPPEERHSIV